MQRTDLGNLARCFNAMVARAAVQVAMTKYEGTARRIGRDIEPWTAA